MYFSKRFRSIRIFFVSLKVMSVKTICFVLSTAMIISVLPVNTAFAGVSFEEDTEQAVSQKISLESLIDEEGFLTDEGLLSLKTLPYEPEKYTEDIDNGDGTRSLKLYSKPIKYKNKDGKFKSIDNSIIAVDSKADFKQYKNAASDIEVLMSENLDQSNAVMMIYKDYSIGFRPLGILNAGEKSSADVNFISAEQEATKDISFNATNKYDSIEYLNTFNEDADIKITPTSTGVKEDIVLYEIPDQVDFSYEFTVDNVIPLLRKDGNVYFVDLKKGMIVAAISAPYMYDSSTVGEMNSSEDISVKLKKTENNTYIYTLIPDREFLEDAVYPVVIDPSINTRTGDIYDTYISSGYPNTNRCNHEDIQVGRTASGSKLRGLIIINSTGMNYIRSQTSGCTIFQVKYHAYQTYSGDSSPSIGVHAITGPWTYNTVTWNNQPSYNSTAHCSKTVDDVKWYDWDITSLGKSWYDGGTNYGILLKIANESLNQYKQFDSDQSTRKDYFEFVYLKAPTLTGSFCGNPFDPNNPQNGTGYVNLSWSAVPDATGYNVKIFNGKEYETFNVGNVTSWNTHNKKIWPTASEIASGVYRLHHDSRGTELATDPVGVYRNSGGSYQSSHNYWFRVTAYNSLGETYTYANGYTPTLPDRCAPNRPNAPAINVVNGAINSGNSTSIDVTVGSVSDTPLYLNNTVYYDILMTKTGSGETTILSGTTAGKHTFVNQEDNKTYSFRIKAYDSQNNYQYSVSSAGVSTLDRTGPVIDASDVSISPTSWTSGNPTISWQNISDEGGGTTLLKYQIDSTTGTWRSLGAYSAGHGTADCSAVTDGQHTVYVRAYDVEGNYSNEIELAYNKDTIGPEASISAPVDENVVPEENDTGNDYIIEAIARDAHLSAWQLDYALGDNPSEDDYNGNIIASGDTVLESPQTRTWNLTGLLEKRLYTLRLKVTDEAGNETFAYTKVLYALDAYKVEATIQLTLTDGNNDELLDEEVITRGPVKAEYSPTTDMLGKLFVNDEEKDAQQTSGDELTFDPLEYNNGWVYPEGSQVFMRAMTKDSSGDYYFTNTTYQLHQIVDVFDYASDANDLTSLNNAIWNNGRMELTQNGGVYSTEGNFKSSGDDKTVNGRILYVNLTADDTIPAGTGISYYLVHDGGEIQIEPGSDIELNISTNDVYLKAYMTSNTAETPSIRSWHLDMMYIPFSQSMVIQNGFEYNARGFCGLDDTVHDPSGNGSIKLFGIEVPIVHYEPEGAVQSTVRVTPGNVYEVFLQVNDETVDGVTSIEYYLSTDGGAHWSDIPLTPGTDANDDSQWILVKDLGASMAVSNHIALKAVLKTEDETLTPSLYDWSLRCRQTMAGEAHDIKLIDEPDKLSTLVDANYMTLLRWEESETEGVTYNVYRSTTPYFDYTQVIPLKEGIAENYWSDYNIEFLQPGQRFYYKVTAVKEYTIGGNTCKRESLSSNEAWADPVSEGALEAKLGLQNYWSYSGFATSAGTGYVNVANGNLVYKATDLVVTGPFYASVMSRTYNSLGETKTPIGYGWDFSFNTCLLKVYDSAGENVVALVLKDGDGTFHRFDGNDGDGYSTAKGTFMKLEAIRDGQEVVEYTIARKDGIKYHFNAATMKLQKFSNENGSELRFKYDDRGNLARVINVIREDGEAVVSEELILSYLVECQLPGDEDYIYVNGNIDMLDTVTWTNGTESIVYTYNYNDDDRLETVSVTTEGETEIIERYEYDADANGNYLNDDEPNFVITDAENRITYIGLTEETAGVCKADQVSVVYDPIKTTTANPSITANLGDHYDFSYDPDGDQSADRTTVTNSYGVGISYAYDMNGLLTSKTDAENHSLSYEHDEDYLVTSVTYQNTINGTLKTIRNDYDYNENGNIVLVTPQVHNGTTYVNLGPQTQYLYEDANFPNKVTSTIAKKSSTETVTSTNDYDSHGNLISTTTTDGSYSGNSDPILIEKTTIYDYYDGAEPGGLRWQLKSVKDNFGKISLYIYDDRGKVTDIEEYLDSISAANYQRTVSKYTYDGYNRTDTVTEAYDKNVTSNPHIIDHTYDFLGRLTRKTNPDGTSERWEYDLTGRLDTYSVGRFSDGEFVTQNSTSYAYDTIGRIKTTTVENDPNISTDNVVSSVDYLHWDSSAAIAGVDADRIVSTDPMGVQTIEKYDILGRLMKTEVYDGSAYITTAEYKYDDVGNMTEAHDSAGRVSKAYYDELGRQVKTVVDPFNASDGKANLNIETRFVYDYLGNTTQQTQVVYKSEQDQTNPANIATSYQYDALARLENVTQANPNYGQAGEPQYLITKYYYDREVTVGTDDLIKNYKVDPKGRVSETYLDKMGYTVMEFNKADTADGDNADGEYMKTLYEYEVHGLPSKTTRTDGTFEKYHYDMMGRTELVEYFEAGATSSTQSTAYDYNNLGQLWTATATNGGTSHDTSYQYDRMGRTVSTWEGTWDNGQPVKETDGLDIAYTYNKAGQVKGIDYAPDGTTADDLVYDYDGYGRISKIKLNPETGDDNVAREYIYDPTTGELTSTKNYRDFATVAESTAFIQTSYTYNSAGMLSEIKYTDPTLNTNGDKITERYTYEYDGRGFITNEKLETDYSTSAEMTALYKAYDYDSLGRLVKAVSGNEKAAAWASWDNETTYTYDQVGNRMGMSVRTGTTTVPHVYSYNQFNQLEMVTKSGSLFESYTYDLRGNQTVKYTDYTSGSATKAEVYKYDLKDQMTEMGTTTDVAGLTNVTPVNTNIYNAGGQRIKKTENSQLTKYFYSGSAILYTTDVNNIIMTENILDLGGQIVASWRDRGTGGETINYYNYDIRGSVTGIVNPDGNAVKQYSYDEFGNISQTGTFENEVTFTGSVSDTSTGLQYMNSRFYNASTGRFLSQDSYSGNAYEPWSQHLYSYTGNNPVNYIDPTGHMRIEGADVGDYSYRKPTTRNYEQERRDAARKASEAAFSGKKTNNKSVKKKIENLVKDTDFYKTQNRFIQLLVQGSANKRYKYVNDSDIKVDSITKHTLTNEEAFEIYQTNINNETAQKNIVANMGLDLAIIALTGPFAKAITPALNTAVNAINAGQAIVITENAVKAGIGVAGVASNCIQFFKSEYDYSLTNKLGGDYYTAEVTYKWDYDTYDSVTGEEIKSKKGPGRWDYYADVAIGPDINGAPNPINKVEWIGGAKK